MRLLVLATCGVRIEARGSGLFVCLHGELAWLSPTAQLLHRPALLLLLLSWRRRRRRRGRN
jgi:hypothetical protein